MAYYEYQKLGENPLDKTVADAWKEREGWTYYALDEKINSLFYLSPSVLTKTIALDAKGGYANGTKITDEEHAVNVAEIPVMNGRDAFDLDFFRQDGTEYLRADGRMYIAETALTPISGAADSVVTIPDTGCALVQDRRGNGRAGDVFKISLTHK